MSPAMCGVKLEMRAPRAAEWSLCRMMLPETFGADLATRVHLLCVREEAPRLVGAVSFRRVEHGLAGLRVHVTPRFRRLQAGRQMVEMLQQEGARSLAGYVDVRREPEGVLFCERLGFRRSNGLTTVEVGLDEVQAYMETLREKATLPTGLRIGALAEAPRAEVARLYARYIAHQADVTPWRVQLAEMPELTDSFAALVGGQTVGILLSEARGELGLIQAIVAEEGALSRWVNLALLSAAVDKARPLGVRRIQFSYIDGNRNTRRAAERFKAKVIDEMAEYKWVDAAVEAGAA